MSKEKQAEYVQKNKEFIFIYEILGIICLLLALISLTKLGIVGKYGMLTFRLLFGDWYFLFLLLLGALGIFFLFVHHHFTIKNIRYLGIILIVLSLITLSHFSMHEFVSSYEGNNLKNTILLYFDYFKNYRPNMMKGGGIVGCVIFYILYFLFSKVGTILICCFTIFAGIVFICKKTIFEFIKMIFSALINGFGGAKSYSHKIKEGIKRFNDDYIVMKKTIKPLSKHYLKDNTETLSNQNKIINEYLLKIKKELMHLGIHFKSINYLVCNHISIVFIKTYQNVNYDVLRISFCKIFNEAFLIRYDNLNDLLIIEINNLIPLSLSMKEAVKISDYQLVLGKNDRNELVDGRENIIIVGRNVKRYLLSLCFYPYFFKSINDYEIIMIDLIDDFKYYKDLFSAYYDSYGIMELKRKLDELLEELDAFKLNSIDELNKGRNEKIKKPLIFINGLNKIISDYEMYRVLEFLLISGSNVGYLFICSILDNNINNDSVIKHFSYRIFLKNDFNITKTYLSDLMIRSMSDVEGFLKYQDSLIRISLLLLNDEEIKKIYKKRGC